MADRVSASITIGGSVTASSYAMLCAVILDEGLSIDWDGTPFVPDEACPGEPLKLFALEVAWGRFEELENYCVRAGLPFVRWSGGCSGSFGPERAVFTGSDDIHLFVVDEADTVLVSRETVERLDSIAELRAHFDAADFAVPPLILS
ncbi:MAG: hypothetical protein JWR80_7489 [Bradyrhizobium sp.]|nr:hypothetical protein [Bradyrhizobium sp.]